jgi:cyclic beta-1,2-glucan synthetase
LKRLEDNTRFLDKAHRRIADAVREKQPVTPDTDWLVDNYFIIASVLRQVRQDLPRSYYSELPALVSGPHAGWPRVYDMAVTLIAHTDSILDENQIVAFVSAYQEVAPLTTGEIWAIPTMLRLSLLENLRHLATQILQFLDDRAMAAAWAREAALGLSPPPMPERPRDTFLVALQHALRDQSTTSKSLWDKLAVFHFDPAEVLQREHGRQAANQVSIGNCVTSLRLLNALDWGVFFEKVSLVEKALRCDPADFYARQDFATRDRYRKAVEQLARGARRPEVEIANLCLARASAATDADRAHVGWYLIGSGRGEFESQLDYHPKLGDRFRSLVTDHCNATYFGLIALIAACLIAATIGMIGVTSLSVAAGICLVLVLPASEIAIGLTNYLVCRILIPRVLPKLDFKDGIAEDCPVFVVIPGMLASPGSGTRLLQRLELHYLANSDRQLWFALLTDYADAPHEHMPDDEAYLQEALEGVRALNHRHAAGEPDRFFVLHRQRRWNPAEGCWMGWERKRGKLDEFNRLLRGAKDTSFGVKSGDFSGLPHMRSVLTLDADTVLPREAAGQMIGTLAHPLNRPRLSADGRRVSAGYAILQPRVSFLFQTGFRSLFARLFAGSAGIDPYTTAVSDVYQDLFGRGTFTGKGLYDIDAFQATAGHAFPENHILSHDLIESNFARCGLATDIEVFDDFPAKYLAYARRWHRWVRGDWQLLPWLARRVPVPGGTAPNVLPLLERWKIVDNLRRSLIPPALVLMLVLGWTVLPQSAVVWCLVVLAVMAVPLILRVVDAAVGLIHGASAAVILQQARTNVAATAAQVLLDLFFLGYHAFLMVDAIASTLLRLFWSRRRLLEWETAAATERRLADHFQSYLAMMWPASALAVTLALVVGTVAPESLIFAAPLLIGWFVSPVVAYWISRPTVQQAAPLSPTAKPLLRGAARKTWEFFQTFVTAEDHWLPPDNFQEVPVAKIAHRTSPTNIGLGMVSSLAAHDLGYITFPELIDGLTKTLDSLEKLQRHRGHFLNWYDTRTLEPLAPAYVSTVDSGNLLACLWTLKQGLQEKLREPMPNAAALNGLRDILHLVSEELDALEKKRRSPTDSWHALASKVAELQTRLADQPTELAAWRELMSWAAAHTSALEAEARGLGDMMSAMPEKLLHWIGRLGQNIRQRRAEIDALAPWLAALETASPTDRNGKSKDQKPVQPASLFDWEKRLSDPAAPLGNGSHPLRAGPLPDVPANSAASQWADALRDLAARAEALADPMDFRFLYNSTRHLFAVGYNVTLGRLDTAHYDLLASEACLASFLAIARGDVPRRHWFHLGRLTTRAAGRLGLISWGATMFEYLMPRLFLPVAPKTLLDTAEQTAVARQIEYGRQTGKPWGISESAFYFLDNAQDYQYESFGVPGLGLKRNLGQNHVVAPYASLLAVGIDPSAVAKNLERIRGLGGEGPYGFYESIDFTPERLPHGQGYEVVRCFMSHHEGMAFIALANWMSGNAMPRRLRAEPRVRAAELLLEESVPLEAPLENQQADEEIQTEPAAGVHGHLLSRRLTSADTPGPRTLLLSNGQYAVLLTNSGAGASTCNGMDVTRWRADRTMDSWGQFVYIRDLERGRVWSCGFQPTGVRADQYEVIYSIDKAEIRRVDENVQTVLEVAVAPDSNLEVRRVTLHNLTSQPRTLELTSYAEVALNAHGADRAHPVFCKLFMETEWVAASKALLCRRRPRSPEQKVVWAVHFLAADATASGPPAFETDRSRFLGRRRTVTDPAAFDNAGADLSGTAGAVLDPIFSLRQKLRLEPGGKSVVTFVTGMVATREEALALADHFQTPQAVTRAFELAWAHARVELRHLRISMEDAHRFQRLAGHVLFPGPVLRASKEILTANRLGQKSLWRLGISGDLPIVVVALTETKDLPLFEKLLAARTYWASRGLQVDLVLLNEEHSGYFEELQRQARALVQSSDARDCLDRPGGVFLKNASNLAPEDRNLLLAAARVVLIGARGSLGTQIDLLDRPRTLPAILPQKATPRPADAIPPAKLEFFNGLGGFTADGREYVLAASASAPPAPWINVVANPDFGFIISDSGSGFTWAGNSQSNRLTPWANDPVSDIPGEAIYLRDETTGAVWSPTPLPIRAGSATEVRHGQGYTEFHQVRDKLDQKLTVFVPTDAPVKVWLLKLRHSQAAVLQLSVTLYAEWVLGTDREQTGRYVVTGEDPETGALLARNAFNNDYGQAVAFADVNVRPRTLTGDRTEFLGRNRGSAAPAAMRRVELSNWTGAGQDPCAALQAKISLKPNEDMTVVFLIGQAADVATTRDLVKKYRQPAEAEAALHAVVESWERKLGTVQVQTPDQALDLLLNRWLLYQTLSCRVWGRSALYQSSGAFGFRDQLQDVLALVHAAPHEARGHILRAAGRQFHEGDVQHWWHPPSGFGIRTRFSDDFLWLPYVVCRYVEATGDSAILDETLPYLKAPALAPDQEEVGATPETATDSSTVFDHCVRALDNGWKLGEHGLPLMGTGDWNDGMNKVGAGGKGESVWDAWFQIACLLAFAAVAEARGDAARAQTCRLRAEQLRQAVETNAWDGAWYLRAFFDDGTPLGSSKNDECQIDSLTQTWAVISNVADPKRALQAMGETWDRLVRTDDRLILLFDPAFDTGPSQPGYIKGYVPGIRENGGQYTHAAVWVALATALLGRGNQAHDLFGILNPIRHTETPQDVARYRVEPYVVAADIYSRPPHVGRGGWTWYTGSAGWLYRFGLETFLGFQREGNRLHINPCVPSDWRGFSIHYRHGETMYAITVENPQGVERGVKKVWLDGQERQELWVELVEDSRRHQVRVEMG